MKLKSIPKNGILYAICILWAVANISCEREEKTAAPPNKVQPIVATGTFIQDGLFANWSDARWQQELTALKAVGMSYIVISPTLLKVNNVSYSLYPSSISGTIQKYDSDVLEACLRNAKNAGFKVFLGLNYNEDWFRVGATVADMQVGNQVADELLNKYITRYIDVVCGWYWNWEISNSPYHTEQTYADYAQLMNINIDHLNTITPNLPFMISPYMRSEWTTSDVNGKMWESIFAKTHFRKGDIFAPQDCIGAGGLTLDNLDEWFNRLNKAVYKKPGLLFWSDLETFDQRFWSVGTIDRFVRQIEIVKPYVSNINTFAYSHYNSPHNVYPKFHETYLEYVKTGKLPEQKIPSTVTNLSVSAIGMLTWTASTSSEFLAGYYIYRGGALVGNNQRQKNGSCSVTFKENSKLSTGTYKYEVCPYTFVGTVANKVSVIYTIN